MSVTISFVRDLERVGRTITDRRLELGYSTQADAAAVADVSTTTWGLMETGRQLPKTRRVRAQVARALEWPLDAIDLLERGREVGGRVQPRAPIPSAAGPGLPDKISRLSTEDRELIEQLVDLRLAQEGGR